MVNDELLQAVVAAPDDDAPRLVYADALLQRGDAWGEMIVISCELARYRDGRRWDERGRALTQRLRQLHAVRFPTGDFTFNFERGFCTEIEVRAGDLSAIAGAPFALLHSLIVDARRCDLGQLARWPRLAELRKLRIFGTSLRPRPRLGEHVLRVVERARGLRELELWHTDVTRDEIAVLLALPQGQQLRRLAIVASASLAGALGGLPWPPLEDLELASCALERVDVEQLVESKALHGLRRLDVSFNGIYDPGVATAIAGVPWSRLEALELLDTGIASSGLRCLLASPHLKGLTELTLGTTAMDEDITPALPGLATELPRLTSLQVRSRQPTRWLPAIARPYEQLDLDLPNLDPAHLAELLVQPALRALRRMRLSMRREFGDLPVPAAVGVGVATAIAGAPLPDLTSLLLWACNLGEAGARALAQAAHLPRELNLLCNEDDFGAAREELAARFPDLQVTMAPV